MQPLLLPLFRRHVQLRPSMDVWAVALICLELILPTPLLQEPHARVLARNQRDTNAFYRWLASETGPIVLPATVAAFSAPLQGLMQQLLQRDAATLWRASHQPRGASSTPCAAVRSKIEMDILPQFLVSYSVLRETE